MHIDRSLVVNIENNSSKYLTFIYSNDNLLINTGLMIMNRETKKTSDIKKMISLIVYIISIILLNNICIFIIIDSFISNPRE